MIIRKNGFSIVEVSVAMLIFSLLVYAVIQILVLSLNRFSRQEDTVICSGEASFIISALRDDFEKCISFENPQSSYDWAPKAVSFIDDKLNFIILSGSEKTNVSWIYNRISKTLQRHTAEKSILIAKNMVTNFTANCHIIGSDGVERIYPPASGTTNMEFSEKKIPLRIWVEMKVSLKAIDKAFVTVNQEYTARFFPIRLNKKMRSIWLSNIH